MIGHRIRCDCGRIQTVSASAPSVPAQTGWLDSSGVQLGAVGLLLVSVLVLGVVVAWVAGLDMGSNPNETPPTASLPPNDSQLPAGKDKPKPPNGNQPRNPQQPPNADGQPALSGDLLALIQRLEDPDVETNRKAIDDLNLLGNGEGARAIPAVVGAARRNDDLDFDQSAAAALKGIGVPRKEDLSCLVEALQLKHPPLRLYVMSALEQMGDKALTSAMEIVVEALKNNDEEVRRRAIDLVTKLGPEARVLALRQLLKPANDMDEVRVRVPLKVLFGQGDLTQKEIAVLIEALDEKRRSYVRVYSVNRLGELRDQAAAAVPVLVRMLNRESDINFLAASIRALGRISDKMQKEVLTELLALAKFHKEETIRVESLKAIELLDRSVLSIRQLLDQSDLDKSASVKHALAEILESRLATLIPKQMDELVSLLRHKDQEINLAGLRVMPAWKGQPEVVTGAVAEAVTAHLNHDVAEIRGAALRALCGLGSAVRKPAPTLFQLLLGRWADEKDPMVRRALVEALVALLAPLKPEEMKELVPFLQHKDKELVLLALKIVVQRKEEAATVAAEVVIRIDDNATDVRSAALAALAAIGPDAKKVLPTLFQRLDKTPDAQRTPLALTVARIDLENPKLVSYLLDGLHPQSLKNHGTNTEPQIQQILLKIGQPAVDGIFTVLAREHRGMDGAYYLANLYNALAKLGPSCKSKANYDQLKAVRGKETELYNDVRAAYQKAASAMYPDR
jgi:HEAT repeat protein